MRFASLPLIWLGSTFVMASLHGVCFVIYLFGDARQLYPYELARPSFESMSRTNLSQSAIDLPAEKPKSETNVIFPTSSTSSLKQRQGTQVDEEAAIHGIQVTPVLTEQQPPATPATDKAKSVTSLQANVLDVVAPFTTSEPPPDADPSVHFRVVEGETSDNYLPFIRSARSSTAPAFKDRLGITWSFEQIPRTRTKSNSSSTPPRNESTLAESLSEKDRVTTASGPAWAFSKNSPVLCPLTGVQSPIVTRAQWEVAVKSMITSIVFTAALGAAILAIPSRTIVH
jgi:hypothetical protein